MLKKVKLVSKYLKLAKRYSNVLNVRKVILDEVSLGGFSIDQNKKLLAMDYELKNHSLIIDKQMKECSKELRGKEK